VIEENQEKTMKIGLQNFIHHTLKCGWRVTKSKGHDQELIMPFMGLKSYFRDINLFHPIPVVP